MVKLYVAHSVELTDFVNKNVYLLMKDAGFDVIGPFQGNEKYFINRSESEVRADPKVKELMGAKWCVDTDMALMKGSDGMIVIRKGGDAYGSIFELVYMAMVLEKPVAFVDMRGDPIYHPWIHHFCICVTDSIHTAIESLQLRFWHNLNSDDNTE